MDTVTSVLEPLCGPLSTTIARFLGPVCVLVEFECNGIARFACVRCKRPFCSRHRLRSTCSFCRQTKWLCGECAPRDETPCGNFDCNQWVSICTTHAALAPCVKDTWYCDRHTGLRGGRACDRCGAKYDEYHKAYECDGETCVAVHDCRPRKRARNPNAR